MKDRSLAIVGGWLALMIGLAADGTCGRRDRHVEFQGRHFGPGVSRDTADHRCSAFDASE